MSRQGFSFIPAIVIITILLVPTIGSLHHNGNEVSLRTDASSMELAGTSTTWHDNCSSTNGWISQSPSSGFDPKHPILESGTLSASGDHLTVTGIADPITERMGPLYVKELNDGISISNIELFEAEVEFTYFSSVVGFLSVYLFDENKQKAVMLRLHDAWAASESHPESIYFDPGEIGDGTFHDEILFGSWSGYLRFWYDKFTGNILGELDDGTPNQAILKTSGNFDSERTIKYIGIQWSRHPGVVYNGDGYHLMDIQLTYEMEQPVSDWLTGWENRKSHLIIGTPGAGVNYQVPIKVYFGSGTDSGNSVFCDSKCQSDFDDIRFTSSDGGTLLDNWRESYFDSDNATFWVEVRDNLDSNVSIYMYYGNPNCTTTSNGPATFVFFDDFNDESIDGSKWETYGPWSEAGGVASFSITGTGGTSILPDLMTDSTWDMRNKSLVSGWRINQLTVNREWGVSCANTVGDDHTRLAYFLAFNTSFNNNVRSYFDGSALPDYDYYNPIIGQYHPGSFMKTEFISTPNNSTKNSWIQNGVVLDTYSGNSFDSTPQHIFLGFYVHGYSNTLESGTLEMEFDYVYLRNQVGVELTQGIWSDTESWLTGWNYRKSHVINGASGAGENYQIKIVVHYGDGTSTGKDVYCQGKCQPDFDDIRFTDNNGTTLLDYWRTNVYNSDNATFWVEVKDDLNYDTTIYMYYGNSSVSTLSNGTATFMFFDDFETGSLDRWDATTLWSISTEYHNDGQYGVYCPGSSTTTPSLSHTMNQTENFLISIDARTFDNFNTFPMLMSSDTGSCYPCTFGWTNVLYYGGTYHDWPQNSTLAYNTWYTMQVGFDLSSGKLRGWKDGFYLGEVDFVSQTTGETPSRILAFNSRGGTQSTRHLAIDNVYIRKWVPLEPTHGNWIGDNVQPAIEGVGDFAYEAGTSGNVIEWTISDFMPTTFELWRDGGVLTSEAWPGGSTIEVNVDNQLLGIHNYTIIVYGESDIKVTDVVFIEVIDTTAPILNHPSDITGDISTASIQVTWRPTDLFPFNYKIYMNGTQVANGTWSSGENLTYSLESLNLASYNVTIAVWDTSGNFASDTVLVDIEGYSVLPFGDILVITISIGSVVAIVVIGGLICRSKGGGPPPSSPSSYDW